MINNNSNLNFQELFHGHDLNKAILKKTPKIIEISQEIISEAFALYSLPQYREPRRIEFHWAATNSFRASASTREKDVHQISLSYGVATSLYKDATLVPLLAQKNLLIDPQLRAKLLLYSSGITRIEESLFNEKNFELVKSLFFSTSLLWIYFHEQAHLFQNHGEIYLEETSGFHGVYDWVEVSETVQTSLTGRDAWIRHCLELSADHEAIHSVLLYEIERKGRISALSVWIILFSVNCLFFRFHENNPKTPMKEASGSHPAPYIRMYLASICVLNFLDRVEVFKHIAWESSREDLRHILDHAITSAQAYAQLTSNSTDKNLIQKGHGNYKSIEKYIYEMAKTWSRLSPKVRDNYFGFSTIMPAWA